MSSEDAVNKWLVETGYPLEMEVANEFRKAGFNVFQADYYVDPVTRDLREIDVVANRIDDLESVIHQLRFNVLIECKNSRDKPWLFFVGNRDKPADRMLFSYRATDNFGGKLLSRAMGTLAGQGGPLWTFESPPAYGVTQALRKKSSDLDASYAALMQVANACRVQSDAANERQSSDVDDPFADAFVFIAVVVVDGDLYDVTLNEHGEVRTKSVDRQIVMWRNSAGGRPFTLIHVVRRSALRKFAVELHAASETLVKWCGSNAKSVAKVFQEKPASE